MSAIFGIVRFDGAEVSERDLERMGNTLAHRGPDGCNSLVDGPVGLGHCLMRVNLEDRFEVQPLYDRDADLTLVADLRLDNRDELAATFGIEAAALSTMPDSGLVLHAYKKWGEDCCRHLVGDFAFAVWNGKTRRLFLARDHMGQRNLLYHVGDGFLAFASEIKGLWALADVPRQLLEEEIGRLLLMAWHTRPDGGTLFAGIHGLTGGMTLTADSGGTTQTQRYWEPGPDPAHEGRDEAYYVAKYRSILSEAVACRLRRLTRPAALLFSAGFDTAAIAGLAGPVVSAQGRKLIALSSVVSDSYVGTKYDIRPWVEACRRVMPHLDIRYLLTKNAPPLRGIERDFAAFDGPAGIASVLNRDVFVEAAASGARLAMDGIGGDYTVNPRGEAALARFLRQGRLREFFSELRPHMRLTGQSAGAVLKNAVIAQLAPPWLLRRVWRLQGRTIPDRSGVPIDKEFRQWLISSGALTPQKFVKESPRTAMRENILAIAKLVSRSAIPGQSLRAALHGLDYTSPFHDKRVVEFGFSVPEDLYVRNGRNRYLACVALADVYPREFQTRGRQNDLPAPDFLAGIAEHIPALSGEIDRMETNGGLSAYIDGQRLRGLLGTPLTHSHARQRIQIALNVARIASFVRWFRRPNR